MNQHETIDKEKFHIFIKESLTKTEKNNYVFWEEYWKEYLKKRKAEKINSLSTKQYQVFYSSGTYYATDRDGNSIVIPIEKFTAKSTREALQNIEKNKEYDRKRGSIS